MLNLNKIENKTLAKLTSDEIGALDLVNAGVWVYRGELKTRYNGMKRQTEDNITFWFEGTNGFRAEFTEIVPEEEGTHEWAARLLNTKTNEYEQYGLGINGCYFFR